MTPEKCPFCADFYFDEFWAGVYHMEQRHLFLLNAMYQAMKDGVFTTRE